MEITIRPHQVKGLEEMIKEGIPNEFEQGYGSEVYQHVMAIIIAVRSDPDIMIRVAVDRASICDPNCKIRASRTDNCTGGDMGSVEEMRYAQEIFGKWVLLGLRSKARDLFNL